MSVKLLTHQFEFVTDTTTRYLGLIGGYGTGKTISFCYKAIHLASLNVGYTGVLLEPTNAMVQDVLIPEFEACLQEAGIPYKFKASPLPQFELRFSTGTTTILFRSGENYRRLAGLNLAFFGVDECDTIEKKVAWKMWRMLQSRLRRGAVYQGFTTSTPEGFGFLYEFFEKELNKTDRRYIRARTMDNPFLPEEFIVSLKENYPAELIAAYLEGRFVNLAAGQIYYKFDRRLNHTDYSIDDVRKSVEGKFDIHGRPIPLPALHIGMDFNINKMAAIVHVTDALGPIAVDEIIDARDTEDMVNIIKERYPDFNITVYPDSSGKNRSHASVAAPTDHHILRAAGFSVVVGSTNPPVKDRINSMNMALCNSDGVRAYRINTNKCKRYTETLEQQTYDANGQPDKSNDTDHPNDAGGYFIHNKYPVKRYAAGGLRMIGV